MTDKSFTRPDDFHLEKYWVESTQNFINTLPEYKAEVEVSPSIVHRMKFTGRFVQIENIEPPTADGWIPVSLRCDTEQEAIAYILGFGDQIRVIFPTSLQQEIYQMARKIVAFYKS